MLQFRRKLRRRRCRWRGTPFVPVYLWLRTVTLGLASCPLSTSVTPAHEGSGKGACRWFLECSGPCPLSTSVIPAHVGSGKGACRWFLECTGLLYPVSSSLAVPYCAIERRGLGHFAYWSIALGWIERFSCSKSGPCRRNLVAYRRTEPPPLCCSLWQFACSGSHRRYCHRHLCEVAPEWS